MRETLGVTQDDAVFHSEFARLRLHLGAALRDGRGAFERGGVHPLVGRDGRTARARKGAGRSASALSSPPPPLPPLRQAAAVSERRAEGNDADGDGLAT
jgi:hypothetical protein